MLRHLHARAEESTPNYRHTSEYGDAIRIPIVSIDTTSRRSHPALALAVDGQLFRQAASENTSGIISAACIDAL